MDVDLTDDEIADRAAAYDLPATPGVLAKYAALVSSASEGAVANPALGRRPVHQQIHEESRA